MLAACVPTYRLQTLHQPVALSQYLEATVTTVPSTDFSKMMFTQLLTCPKF